MKKIICTALSLLVLLPVAGFASNNVCTDGVGIPPFLSSGAKPNLLMVIDNSGSMLDAAYSKPDSFCFDDTYATGTVYAGYFKSDTWYKWTADDSTGTNGPYPPWGKGVYYGPGARVYANGIIWENKSTGTALIESGCNDASAPCDSIDEDDKVAWSKIFSIPKWKSGTAYKVDDIVWSGPQLYKATKAGALSGEAAGTSSDVLNLAADTGVAWVAVDSTWLPNTTYPKGNIKIVSYKGILYEVASAGKTSATSLYDDTAVTWKRLNEGSFVEVDSSSAASYCSGATGTKHTHQDFCITIDASTTKTPNQVTAFAAKGNMLNWTMSSKFDVEKEILTGGKHDYYDQYLISEHRGCSGSRLIKQIQLNPVAPATGKFLSLGVRAAKHSDSPQYEDRIDSTDDTGRLEVLAVTDKGYQMNEKCQTAITRIIKNEGDLNGTQNVIKDCVDSFPASGNQITDMRPTLNHSLQACWQDDPNTSALEINSGHWNGLIDDCRQLYMKEKIGSFTPTKAYDPADLRPADGGPYLCYGLYDSTIDHQNRVGYMGRCWNSAGSGGMADCNPWKLTDCTGTKTPKCLSACATSPCYWEYDASSNPVIDSTQMKFKTDTGLIYQCTNDNGSKCTKWSQMYRSSAGSTYTTSNCGGTTGGTTGAGWEVSTWPDNKDVPAPPGNCILQAIADYCGDLRVPEVIDPSSSTGKTSVTGGMPGLLRDSELMAFLGGKDPLITMKGRIQQVDRPTGIIHNVAGDLRLGAMSFRYVGAKTECDLTASTTSKLERYCPANNYDGAQLLTYNNQLLPLEVGDYVKSETDTTYPKNSNKRRHVDELAEAINTIRGTSWTPLAEALYTAVGYYAQNINFCLNKEKDGSGNYTGYCLDYPLCKNFNVSLSECQDVPIVKDPVQYWCQDNHIIVITEGESTADINAAVKTFTKTPSTNYLSYIPAVDTLNGDGDNADQQYCVNSTLSSTPGDLYGSAYLDNMTWWGRYVKPLYQNRYVEDPDGNKIEKQTIYTHVVTTGSLTNSGSGECNPTTLMTQTAVNGGTKAYYPGENPQQLEDNLYAVLDDILSRSSAGSAASVISSSRSGSGAVYQAVFWPKYEDDSTPKNKVSWIGDVHSLFVSSDGLMYEDTDQNGKLTPSEDVNNNNVLDTGEDTNGNSVLDGTDKRVVFYFSTAANRTRGCYNVTTLVATGQCPEPALTGDLVPACVAGNDCVEIQNINYLWSANRRLRAINNVLTERKIYTWNDANNDGIVDADEYFALSSMTGAKWDALNQTAFNSGTRGPVTRDFIPSDKWVDLVKKDSGKTDDPNITDGQELDALNALIGWIQGADQLNDEITTDSNTNGRLDKALRSRQFKLRERQADGTYADLTKEWRLGDIIHSTPIAVSKPAEAYQFIYRDPTYANFAARWAKRRTMVYFGGNDGMLHAINGGFYFENGNQFCCTDAVNTDGSCAVSPSYGVCPTVSSKKLPDMGREMWAYIPYNLQPHLKCLTDKFYAHKYYIDQKPRIFDAQIFTEEAACKATNGLTSAGCIHPGGWGTILVGSMRFGGTPVNASDLNGVTNDKREFTSSFFVMDITNPEAEQPELLGEFTRTTDKDGSQDKYVDLNYTTSSPSMIIMRDGGKDAVSSKWYLVMGNGPVDLDGSNTAGKQALLAVLPMEWLKGKLTWSAGRPDSTYVANSKAGFRLLNKLPGEPTTNPTEGGRFLVPYGLDKDNNQMPGFVSDIISVDYNIDITAPDQLGSRYRTDAIYFGTMDGAAFTKYPNTYLPKLADQFYWKGGGRLFRLVTKMGSINSSTGEFDEVASTPLQWAGYSSTLLEPKWTDGATNQYSSGPVRLLADLKMPVIAGPSIGYDGYNYWIYSGTGRFYNEKDKTDDGWCLGDTTSNPNCAQRSKIGFFGLKEPLKDARSNFINAGWNPANDTKVTCKIPVMTWGSIDWNINQDISTGSAKNNTLLRPNNAPGKRGLMQTDDILAFAADGTNPVRDIKGKALAYLACYEQCSSYATCKAVECSSTIGGSNPCEDVNLKCFPGADTSLNFMKNLKETGTDALGTSKEYYTFPMLQQYIAGTCDISTGNATGLDGWYRDFHDSRERNLGTSALLGGLLTYTTYQPFNDKCRAEGESSLYGIHFQTGTPWIQSVFGTFNIDSSGNRTRFTKTGGTYIMDKLSLGRGLSTTPSMHVGTGDQAAKAFIQTSTGEIVEVNQQNLPITNQRSGRQNWTDRCGAE